MDRSNWEAEQERRKILQDSMVTDIKKNKFISDIIGGLGEEIKKEPNTIHKRPSFWSKIKVLIGWN
jgi:hypothetical protein